MNEAEFSDDDSDKDSNDNNRLAHMQKSATQVPKSGRDHLDSSKMDGTVNSFMGGNRTNVDDTSSRRPNQNRDVSKMQSNLTSDMNNDMSQSQWGAQQQSH